MGDKSRGLYNKYPVLLAAYRSQHTSGVPHE
jgi:hypothetical protein